MALRGYIVEGIKLQKYNKQTFMGVPCSMGNCPKFADSSERLNFPKNFKFI